MKYSVLNQIRKIRNETLLDIDTSNSNEFRVLIKEHDGLSAYYFSCPIYRLRDKKLIDLKFYLHEKGHLLFGYNCQIKIDNQIEFTGDKGNFCLTLNNNYNFNLTDNQDRQMVTSADIKVYPTFNGIIIEQQCNQNTNNLSFDLKFNNNRSNIRTNGNYFAVMQEELVPLMTICAMFAKNCETEEISPVNLQYFTKDNQNFQISVDVSKVRTRFKKFSVFIDVNMYSPKMIFDTTVESANPDKNNAFGSVAFLGNSEDFGEQWLYSRMDTSQLLDLTHLKVEKANLYIPKFSKNDFILEAFKMSTPWCSFGSTWNNKIDFSELLLKAKILKDYKVIEVLSILEEILKAGEIRSSGMVIKLNAKANEFEVLSTGDNYYMPQILEIKFKNKF